MKDPSKFPPGWDEARIRRVLEHYEGQSAAAAAAADAAAFAEQGQTVMVIPNELVPAVRMLLASNESIKTEFWDEIRHPNSSIGSVDASIHSTSGSTCPCPVRPKAPSCVSIIRSQSAKIPRTSCERVISSTRMLSTSSMSGSRGT